MKKILDKEQKPYGFWNWGTGIAIAIIVAASLMIFLVYKSMNVTFDMAEKDYYAVELKHNDKMLATKNGQSLSAPIDINETEDLILIKFPKECIGTEINGTLLLYRPSAQNKDVLLPFTPDENGIIMVDKQKLIKGKYELKADWEMNKMHYNIEQPFFVEFN
jgi:hypothetical protein